MRALRRWLLRLLALVLVLVAGLLAPVGYTELACRGAGAGADSGADFGTGRAPLVGPAWRRAESRTLLTYPEWHIVHAYDDYARVIRTGDPHDFAYLRAIAGFWSALCPLSERAADLGDITFQTKATIYTIGVSFTAEMLTKAVYEEVPGRIATWLRGPERAPLDDLSAAQASEYARFLQQVPWYKWDFKGDAAALEMAASGEIRDLERRFALGLEYRAKAAYARVIAGAVAEVGADELRLRSVVAGLDNKALAGIEGVTVIGAVEGGTVIETDRYRAFTGLLERLAAAGADLVEIAGNDEILFTVLSDKPAADGALYSFPRQGYGDYRHLIFVPVSELLDRLRARGDLRLEHVHDY